MPCGYLIDEALSYGFWLGEDYDPSRELIIDPLLPCATLLGGAALDLGYAVAADAEGCAYITGITSSTDFPITPGAFQASGGSAFVTKFSADGSRLLYSTYLGGSSDKSYILIAIDSVGYGTHDMQDSYLREVGITVNSSVSKIAPFIFD